MAKITFAFYTFAWDGAPVRGLSNGIGDKKWQGDPYRGHCM